MYMDTWFSVFLRYKSFVYNVSNQAKERTSSQLLPSYRDVYSFMMFIRKHLRYARKSASSQEEVFMERNSERHQATGKSISKSFDPNEPVGDFAHIPLYNVRTAAQGYSNIAGVLAGFAFAAVVLVVSNPRAGNVLETGVPLQDWVTIAFLIAFFGCTLSAFVYSVVAAEEILAPRTNMIALFGAAGFSVSISFVLWGLVSLIHIFLDKNVVTIAQGLYAIFSLLQPSFVCSVAFDNIYMFQRHHPDLFGGKTRPEPTFLQWFVVLMVGYFPILVAIGLRTFWWISGGGLAPDLSTRMLYISAIAGVLTITLSGFFALFASYKRHGFTLTPYVSTLWILPQAVVGALLILLI